MEIRFVHTPDCRECVKEMKNASKEERKAIIKERERLAKCKFCPRLQTKDEVR
ncbi:MAG TPA: hypothetical protein GXX36_03280 [Clostridiaceae bacterium]|nr:hypothetical protein [Clostridiaceae bacterium]